MAELNSRKARGPRVVSTFSGCGGSCLGFRSAGYRVVWANEFIPAAAEVYRLNHPSGILSTDDIRAVQPDAILDSIGIGVGELDVLEGSPPCASFSLAGKRDKTWGQVKKYSDTKQVVDDLFFEYVRLLRGLKPRAFVAENVPGLVIGAAKGVFKQVMRELRESGYVVGAALVTASQLGVAQRRQRLIFVGIREDLGKEPRFPTPIAPEPTLGQALSGLSDPGEFSPLPDGVMRRIYNAAAPGECFRDTVSRVNRIKNTSYFTHHRLSFDEPAPTLMASAQTLYHPDEPRTLGINEAKRVSSFPDDFQLTGTFPRRWERLGRSVPPVMMAAIATTLKEVIA